MVEIAIKSFVETSGRVPFQAWLDALDRQAQAKIDIALYRLMQGNRSQVKGVGGGVAELKWISGPAIGFTSDRMARRWSFCSAAVPRSGRAKTS
jgi:putative component of toxin-antitoxin plasmid stabilization module